MIWQKIQLKATVNVKLLVMLYSTNKDCFRMEKTIILNIGKRKLELWWMDDKQLNSWSEQKIIYLYFVSTWDYDVNDYMNLKRINFSTRCGLEGLNNGLHREEGILCEVCNLKRIWDGRPLYLGFLFCLGSREANLDEAYGFGGYWVLVKQEDISWTFERSSGL